MFFTNRFLFNCTTAGKASDSLTALTQSFIPLDACPLLGLTIAQIKVSLALKICESWAIFLVPSKCVKLIGLFFCNNELH